MGVEACRSAHEAYIVKPGTDAALALAMMHVIVRESLHDEDFIAAHTTGFDELEPLFKSFTDRWGVAVLFQEMEIPEKKFEGQEPEALFDLVIDVASGQQSKSEALGMGEVEYVPWNPYGIV